MLAEDIRLTKNGKIGAKRKATFAKRHNQICKVYELKVVSKRLNKQQKEQLKLLFLEAKWFYNHVLSIHKSGIMLKDIDANGIKEVERFDKDKQKFSYKLQLLSGQQKQAIVARMVTNEKSIASLVKHGHQIHGSLQFKSEVNCIPLKQYGQTHKFKTFNKVKIQAVKKALLVKEGGQLQDVDDIANVNLLQRPDGYYLKVTTFIDKKKHKGIKQAKKEIGLDFGVKTAITTSDGKKIDCIIEESDRIKKLQNQLSKKEKRSDNRRKNIQQLRKAYQHLSNQKQDKANKIVYELKKHRLIVMQDEQLNAWKQQFGKKIQHSILGRVKAKLQALSQTVVLDRFIPTTKLCVACGKKHDNIKLSDRQFVCECGCHEDRDIHAAKNMLAIWSLAKKNLKIPPEQRKLTLMEFKASAQQAWTKK